MIALLTAASILVAPIVPIVAFTSASLGINHQIQLHRKKTKVEPIK